MQEVKGATQCVIASIFTIFTASKIDAVPEDRREREAEDQSYEDHCYQDRFHTHFPAKTRSATNVTAQEFVQVNFD